MQDVSQRGESQADRLALVRVKDHFGELGGQIEGLQIDCQLPRGRFDFKVQGGLAGAGSVVPRPGSQDLPNGGGALQVFDLQGHGCIRHVRARIPHFDGNVRIEETGRERQRPEFQHAGRRFKFGAGLQ